MPVTPRPLDAVELGAYLTLVEVTSLLRHAVEQQLREAGNLSYVQFQLLARLGLDSPTGSLRMTYLADGGFYCGWGLTYLAGVVELAGVVTRTPAADDERGVTVAITAAGRELLATVMPGHTEVVHHLLLAPLSRHGVTALGELLTPVRDHMRSAPPRSAAPRRRRRPSGTASSGSWARSAAASRTPRSTSSPGCSRTAYGSRGWTWTTSGCATRRRPTTRTTTG